MDMEEANGGALTATLDEGTSDEGAIAIVAKLPPLPPPPRLLPASAPNSDMVLLGIERAMEATLARAMSPVMGSLRGIESRLTVLEDKTDKGFAAGPLSSSRSSIIHAGMHAGSSFDGGDGARATSPQPGEMPPGAISTTTPRGSSMRMSMSSLNLRSSSVGSPTVGVGKAPQGGPHLPDAAAAKEAASGRAQLDPLTPGDLVVLYLDAKTDAAGGGGFLAGDTAYGRCGVRGFAGPSEELAFEELFVFRVVPMLAYRQRNELAAHEASAAAESSRDTAQAEDGGDPNDEASSVGSSAAAEAAAAAAAAAVAAAAAAVTSGAPATTAQAQTFALLQARVASEEAANEGVLRDLTRGETSTSHGPFRYGQGCQLQHVSSGLFLRVRGDAAPFDPDCRAVDLGACSHTLALLPGSRCSLCLVRMVTCCMSSRPLSHGVLACFHRRYAPRRWSLPPRPRQQRQLPAHHASLQGAVGGVVGVPYALRGLREHGAAGHVPPRLGRGLRRRARPKGHASAQEPAHGAHGGGQRGSSGLGLRGAPLRPLLAEHRHRPRHWEALPAVPLAVRRVCARELRA